MGKGEHGPPGRVSPNGHGFTDPLGKPKPLGKREAADVEWGAGMGDWLLPVWTCAPAEGHFHRGTPLPRQNSCRRDYCLGTLLPRCRGAAAGLDRAPGGAPIDRANSRGTAAGALALDLRQAPEKQFSPNGAQMS